MPPFSPVDARMLEHLIPLMRPIEARIAMTVSCRDADPIPKIEQAGEIGAMPDGTPVQLMHNGVIVQKDGYYGAWNTRLIQLCRGHHEPQEERMFHEVVSCMQAGGTMVEIGGFWAYYSIWFLRAAAGRRAVLVEPDPAHAAIGWTNLGLNQLRAQADIIPGFIGPKPGSAMAFETESSGRLDLPCLDLAAIMERGGMSHLSILHCDAQGQEFNFLEQAAPLLQAGRVDWLFISTHHHSISGDPMTHQRCVHLLLALGATIEAEYDVHESFSGDGLICARFCEAPTGYVAPRLSRNRACDALFRHALNDLALAMQAGR
jgi:FkbM family methyltransferase